MIDPVIASQLGAAVILAVVCAIKIWGVPWLWFKCVKPTQSVAPDPEIAEADRELDEIERSYQATEAKLAAQKAAEDRRAAEVTALMVELGSIESTPIYLNMEKYCLGMLIIMVYPERQCSDGGLAALKDMIAFKRQCLAEHQTDIAFRYNMRGGIHIPGLP